MNWRELFEQAAELMADRQAARWLVEEASGGRWPALLDGPVTPRAGNTFSSMVERRQSGEPIQYVLGHWAFRDLDLMVDRRALIPRPETEIVADVALGELDKLATAGVGAPVVCDLGTGCGAIALAIASSRPDATVWAGDISAEALQVASANLAGLGARCGGRAHLVQGPWWAAFPEDLRGCVDLAVSNPPYIAAHEWGGLPGEVARWEPMEALVAGPTGLEAFGAIIDRASEWTKARSVLVLELAPHQAVAVARLAEEGGFADIEVLCDLAGRQRVLVARRWP